MRTTLLTTTALAMWCHGAAAQDDRLFQAPFRIQTVSGAYVDVGDATGYAGPTLGDVDGDGQADLIVGQFDGGHFRVFKNVGKDGQRAFTEHYFLKARDELASVPMG